MVIHEPAVVFTDFVITVLCLIFCWKLWSQPADKRQLNRNFFGLFAAAAGASLFGAIVHGFLPNDELPLTRFFWLSTLVVVGISSYNLWLINLHLLFNDRLVRSGRIFFRLLFLVYVFVVLTITQEFVVAILGYIPAASVLFLILARRTWRDRNKFNLFGLFGLLLTFVAAYVQQARIGIDPQYFDHNALYHVLQALGLWGLYLFGSRISRWTM